MVSFSMRIWVAHAPDGLGGFLLEKTHNPPYLIDPLTHAFQHELSAVTNSEGNVKSSIMKLAEAYGEPILSSVGKSPLLPKSLGDTELLGELCKELFRISKKYII